MPIISVIMSTFNESKCELNRSINSILNQTFTDFEFIIIDDNPSRLHLKYYLLNKSKKDNRIKISLNKKNIGLERSLNKGLKISKGKYIARMDADDVSNSHRLMKQFKFMRKFKLDFVFSNSMIIDIHGNIIKKHTFVKKKIINQNIIRKLFLYYFNFSVHSSWLLKKSIYVFLNGYRNVKAAEDYDFILRALIFGYKLGYQPDLLITRLNRLEGISATNTFNQFISSKILKKMVKSKKVFSLNYIHKMRSKIITPLSIRRFRIFKNNGHRFKYFPSVFTFIEFIFSMIKSINAIKFIINILKNKLIEYYIYNYSKLNK